MGFTNAIEPVLRVLPEIPKPTRRPSLTERFVWTGIALVLYLAMAHTPIYGIPWQTSGFEQLVLLRVITASRRGTLMELGIGPLVTSGLIWQLLVGSKIVNIDIATRRGRALFTGAQKLFSIIFTIVQALAFIVGGAYGPLSPSIAILVFLQLTTATLIVLLLDEMLQKGWGIGSGVSLFIAAGVSQDIFWRMFSPLELRGGLPLGIIPATVVAITNGVTAGSWDKLYSIILRVGYPDILGLISTFAFFIALMYLENMRIDIPIGVSRYGGIRSSIPLKFLYVSNIPIILVSALYANVHIFSQLIWLRINKEDWIYNNILKYLFNYNQTNGQLIPLKGTLVYYLNPPRSYLSILKDPVHFTVYSLLFIGLCVLFSIIWIQTSGMDPWSQARQLAESGIYVPGFRKSPRVIASILSRYVPTLSILSGLLVALIAIASDIVGVFGGGIGILLLVGILAQYQALIVRERALEMYPLLRKLTGVR